MRSKTLVLTALLFSAGFCLAACPSADLTGDCFVDYEDFALMANRWLTTDPCIPDDMVYIPDGEFQMGDSFGEGGSDELPLHTVQLDSFAIGKFEVTNRQYCDYLNSAIGSSIYESGGTVYGSGNNQPYCGIWGSQIVYNGAVFTVRAKNGRDMSNDPMVKVCWYGAAAYCNWRSQQEEKEICYNTSDPNWPCDFSKNGYRLPTEAEWEYAARGGLSGRRFPWGDTITHTQANYYSSALYSYDISPTRGHHPTYATGSMPYTSPIGSFEANGYGLYDMAGNVWEWCNEWWQHGYYSSSPTNNPTGPITGMYRVLRGGNWLYDAYNCRVAYRELDNPHSQSDFHIGFRLVLDFQ